MVDIQGVNYNYFINLLALVEVETDKTFSKSHGSISFNDIALICVELVIAYCFGSDIAVQVSIGKVAV